MTTTTLATKHTCDASERAFGRRAPGCPRCAELAAGSPARDWNGRASVFASNRRIEEKRSRAIRNHDCRQSRCGSVCTFGDW